MKYVVLLSDGMADYRIGELGNKTILEYANKPNMDKLASQGSVGLIHTVPPGMSPGSDICNLTIFGYSPEKYYTGRSSIEAVSVGVDLKDYDNAFRCNLVTYGEDSEGRRVIEDFTANHISNDDAARAMAAINERLKDDVGYDFYSGVSYRNLFVFSREGTDFELTMTPPHDIIGQPVADYLPKGLGSWLLNRMMEIGNEVVSSGDFGDANGIWLWGHGLRPSLPRFQDLYGLRGAVISGVDLVKGIGIYTGMDIIDVDGATGSIDTNYANKAAAAARALDDVDYLFLHIEAPDEAGHMGSVEEKIKAVEAIDEQVIPVIMEKLESFGDYRIMVTPDHYTPIALRTHTREPVPAVIYGKGVKKDKNEKYTEYIKPSFEMTEGWRIGELFINAEEI